MPNWKSYESSVRLLSAIVAAHPGLKLNYDEVGRFYGDGAKYKSVWDRMSIINKNAKLLTKAVEAGLDPFKVELIDTTSKAQDIAARFGGDCTASALENRFRRIKKDAHLINDSIKKGVDPITLPIGDTDGEAAVRNVKRGSGQTRVFRVLLQALSTFSLCSEIKYSTSSVRKSSLICGTELARCFGSDATRSAIETIFARQIHPGDKAITNALNKGSDPKNLVAIFWILRVGNGASEIVKCYGTNCTKKGLDHHFKRDIRPNVNAIRDALARGDDPKDLTMMENVRDGKIGKEIVKHYGSHSTKSGLLNHFDRDLTPNVKLLRQAVANGQDAKSVILIEGVRPGQTGKEIARCFGKSITTKSIIDVFHRQVRPDVRLILETLKAGGDPEELLLAGIAKIIGAKTTAKCFGDGLNGKALSMHFLRNVRPSAQLILDALARGEDPAKTVLVGSETKAAKEIQQCFGSDATAGGIKFQFATRFNKDVKLIKDARANGIDCKDIKLSWADKSTNDGNELAKHFGSDTTAGALSKHYSRSIKADVDLLRACVKEGQDPKDLVLAQVKTANGGKGANELSSIMGSDTTPNGIRFQFTDRFRPIAKRQLDMKASGLDPKDINLDSVKGKGSQGQSF
ncbi:hypothetical protein N431DRAFT_447767 [Stipitochalara longipes BDJ]|nr:hypothetical protein N431DRAFT_447767 [Stipitochalara longipes BDJ]